MEAIVPTKLRIAEAAIRVARASGLANLTVGEVAKEAGVSTALVHYHFDTKQALIVAAAERAGTEEAEAMAGAFAHGRGLETLDRIWEVLQERVTSGAARMRAELLVRTAREPDVAAVVGRSAAAVRAALASRLPALLRELGAALTGPADEVAAAIAALLDGLALTLCAGAPAAEVRTAYDAFWLTLLAAGQSVRRR
jgi:TetR/AcrR family transcriptional regulator, regulator of biofilm formation and stress response